MTKTGKIERKKSNKNQLIFFWGNCTLLSHLERLGSVEKKTQPKSLGDTRHALLHRSQSEQVINRKSRGARRRGGHRKRCCWLFFPPRLSFGNVENGLTRLVVHFHLLCLSVPFKFRFPHFIYLVRKKTNRCLGRPALPPVAWCHREKSCIFAHTSPILSILWLVSQLSRPSFFFHLGNRVDLSINYFSTIGREESADGSVIKTLRVDWYFLHLLVHSFIHSFRPPSRVFHADQSTCVSLFGLARSRPTRWQVIYHNRRWPGDLGVKKTGGTLWKVVGITNANVFRHWSNNNNQHIIGGPVLFLTQLDETRRYCLVGNLSFPPKSRLKIVQVSLTLMRNQQQQSGGNVSVFESGVGPDGGHSTE